MMSDLDRYEAAIRARDGLIATIAQTSARAAYDIGVEFDVDDPRVARWLILTTFEGMFMSSAKSTSRELIAMIVTWDHLVAWADADPPEKSSSRRSKL